MNPTESFLVLVLAGLATMIALGAVQVAPAILHSSVSQAFLLVMTLVLFAYSPVVGIAAIALFVILMFKRNVQKTQRYTQVVQQFAQESMIPQQAYVAQPHAPVVTQPQKFVQGLEEGYASPEEVGTYPLGDQRPTAQAAQTFNAMYRPAEDMGDNTFMDEPSTLENSKVNSFAY